MDIDPQAVEVTKLSLLLKVLEGEDEQTIGQQLALFPEHALPDLGRNIYRREQTGSMHLMAEATLKSEYPETCRYLVPIRGALAGGQGSLCRVTVRPCAVLFNGRWWI